MTKLPSRTVSRLLLSIMALALGSSLRAQDAEGKVLFEAWDAAYLQSTRAGHIHTIVEEVTRDGEKLRISKIQLRLNVKRFADNVQLNMDNGTVETPEGKVVAVFMQQVLGKNQSLMISGVVKDNMMHLTLNGKDAMKPVPWDDKVAGLYAQQTMFRDRKAKPGDEFSYLSFEPTLSLVVTNPVKVLKYEDVTIWQGQQQFKLLRAEIKPDRVQNTQLPTQTVWLDERGMQMRSEADIPLGKLILIRTSRDIAMTPLDRNTTLPDISQHVVLKQRMLNPYDTHTARYRITIRDDADPGSSFAKDLRQNVVSTKGSTMELDVRAPRADWASQAEEKAGAEFTQSSYFINSTDDMVKAHAQKAVGGETDPWKKVLRIEKWVNQNMKSVNHESLATSDHVARTMQGDCTEFAMLMAAMCRAEGVPSRTALGLIFAEVKGGPVFAFHMWTEVWIDGKWIPFDATLGRGYVGASHLKIADHSWHDERTLTPILPIMRVLGKVSIEIVSANSK